MHPLRVELNSAPLGPNLFSIGKPEGSRIAGYEIMGGVNPSPGYHPAALIGCDGSREDDPRFNARPVTTQKYHYPFVSVIASLGVQPQF